MAYRVTSELAENAPGVGLEGDLMDVADFSTRELASSYAKCQEVGIRVYGGGFWRVNVSIGWVPDFDAQVLAGN